MSSPAEVGDAGHGAPLEQRIKKKDAKGTAFADLMWKPRCLIEMKKTGVDLGRVYRQAFDYWVQAVPAIDVTVNPGDRDSSGTLPA